MARLQSPLKKKFSKTKIKKNKSNNYSIRLLNLNRFDPFNDLLLLIYLFLFNNVKIFFNNSLNSIPEYLTIFFNNCPSFKIINYLIYQNFYKIFLLFLQ